MARLSNDFAISRKQKLSADDRNFGEKMLKHSQKLKAHAAKLFGIPALAEDLMQETLLSAWESRNNFQAQENGSGMGPWLSTLMKRRHSEYYRRENGRRGQRKKFEFQLVEEPPRHIDDDEYKDCVLSVVYSQYLNHLCTQDTQVFFNEVKEKLEGMSTKQGSILREFALRGRDPATIAEQRQMTEGAVNTNLYNARQRLRKLLGE